MRHSYRTLLLWGLFACLTGITSAQTVDTIQVVLKPLAIDTLYRDWLEVCGVRAGKSLPVTRSYFVRRNIEQQFFGQDLSFFLNRTPNVTSASDGGHFQNFTRFRLRGMEPSQVNFTLDGVPLSEPENFTPHFIFLPDFLKSLQSVEIQRGVGVSTNGNASFAGSLNMGAPTGVGPRTTEFQLGYGSFQTYRLSAEHNTGWMANKTAWYTRFSMNGSDGYKYHSGNNSYSFFLSGGWFRNNDHIKVTAFTGQNRHDRADFAVAENDLRFDARTNDNSEGTDERFNQSLAMLQYTRFFRPHNSWVVTAWYQRYEGDRDDQGVTGMLNTQRGANWGGGYTNLNLKWGDLGVKLGLQGNAYYADRSMTVVPSIATVYENTDTKQEGSAYLKATYSLQDFTFYADAQARLVRFGYVGDVPMEDQNWQFFNPKAGISWRPTRKLRVYAYAGRTGREPTRNTLFSGLQNLLTLVPVTPEYVTDGELGLEFEVKQFRLSANGYYMDFRDEIVFQGNLGPNGLPVMGNVEQSFRSGLELDAAWRPARWLELTNVSAFSYNRIQVPTRTFEPILTPAIILNQGINTFWARNERLQFGVNVKYHSASWLDWENTLQTPAFLLVDARASWRFRKFHTFSVVANNLTNANYFTDGYVVGGMPYYYVNMPVNWMSTLQLKF